MKHVIRNPYSNDLAPWLKGNLHTHTSESDGARPPQEVIDAYAARGYDFLTISDHDLLVDPTRFDSRGMTLIPGNEVTADGPHILHVNAATAVRPDSNRQTVLDAIGRQSGFAVVPHPNWEKSFAHCPQSFLESWKGYIGIEVYNGVVRRLDGSPLATDRWDRLLGQGRKVWGFGSDDSHRPEDDEIAWNMVQSTDRSATAILDALISGRFYASTGVYIKTIRVFGRTIDVRTENAERIIAYSDFGHREATVDGDRMVFTIPDSASIQYVRIECWGPGERMAWTQPFYIERV